MKLGIDLRPLQTGHKYRGIGEVAKRVTSYLVSNLKQGEFTFFVYNITPNNNPLELLDLKDKRYDVVELGHPLDSSRLDKKSKFNKKLKEMFGAVIPQAAAVNVFLQFDYALGVPTNTKTLLIKHDIIPFLFWEHFFESPKKHLSNKALRTALRTAFNNYHAVRVLKRSIKNADKIVTVSEHTKRDIVQHLNAHSSKIYPAHLGVSHNPARTTGAIAQSLPKKPYLLFVGGIDPMKRRAVDDIVSAFNNLKAAGKDIQLVLVGENFKLLGAIPHDVVRKAVNSSSYKDDIIALGYVSDETKQQLFKNAIAFVFPTKYEGFGIPLLEAMLLNCPVITYRNSAVSEVVGNSALYAKDWQSIMDRVGDVMSWSPAKRKAFIEEANTHARQFTWDKFGQFVQEKITELVR